MVSSTGLFINFLFISSTAYLISQSCCIWSSASHLKSWQFHQDTLWINGNFLYICSIKKLLKWSDVKMISWQNDKLTKWPVGKMTTRPNDQLTKWSADKMTSCRNDQLTKWPVDKMTSWQNDQLTKWPADKMTSWQNDFCQNDF